jgi:hypothetical protein
VRSRSRASVVAIAIAIAVAVVVAVAPAGALPILEEGDAVELANKLAEATEEQGVCYGWVVNVQDDGGSLSGVDTGSSLGPGRSPFDPSCAPYVVFVADLHYTSETSEAADRATYSIESNLPGFEARGLDSLGISGSSLLGDKDDLVVANATALLPGLVAEQGLAPPIPIEEAPGTTIPDADRPTNTPGSDRLRTYWPAFTFAGLLLLGGVVWLGLALFVRHMQQTDPDFALSEAFDTD